MVAGGVIAPLLLSFFEHSQLTACTITRMESITRTRIESTEKIDSIYKCTNANLDSWRTRDERPDTPSTQAGQNMRTDTRAGQTQSRRWPWT